MSNPAPQEIKTIPNRQWNFVLIDNDCNVFGTDERQVAEVWVQALDHIAIDLVACQIVDEAGNQSNIPEQQNFHF